jgi:hypothetical protein
MQRCQQWFALRLSGCQTLFCREAAYFSSIAYSSPIRFRASSLSLCECLYRHHGFSAGMGPTCGLRQRPSFTFRTEQPIVACEGIRLQHTMIVAKVLLRMFSCRSGEKANHAAGGSDEPALLSSRTYVQIRPVFVFLPGASTGTGVSSVCSLWQSIT